MTTRKRCPCGWLRPLMFATTRRGAPPSDPDLIVGHMCPNCGAGYVGTDLPADEARAVLASLPGFHAGRV